MIEVKAPKGYRAIRQWRDAARQWEVAVLKNGDTYWTILGYIGHAHLTDDELNHRAEARISCPRLGIHARSI